MTVKELLETKPHDYHLSHVYIYTDCLKQCRRMKFLDKFDIDYDVPNSKQNLIDKIIKKYGEREVLNVSDHADQFCVFRTEIELKLLDEELNYYKLQRTQFLALIKKRNKKWI